MWSGALAIFCLIQEMSSQTRRRADCHVPSLALADNAAGDVIACQELRGPIGGLVSLTIAPAFLGILGGLIAIRLGDIVVHELLTLAVEQSATLAADAFGDQNSLHARRPDHAGGMELDELHVLQFGAGVIGQRMAIAGAFPAIARDLVRLADATRRQDHGLRLEDEETAQLPRVSKGSRNPIAILEQADNGVFHEHIDALMDAMILQRADHLEAGAVADVGQAGIAMAAEVALQDLAIGSAVEDGAPGLQLPNARRRLLGVDLGHAPVVDILSAAHGVGEMDLPVVALVDIAQRGGHAALGHHRMRLAQQRLAHQANFDAGRGSFDGRSQSGTAGADDQDVMFVSLKFGHCSGNPEGLVVPVMHRTHLDIQVAKTDPYQAAPGEQHMAAIQAAHAVVHLLLPQGAFDNWLSRPPTICRSEWHPKRSYPDRMTFRSSTRVPTPIPEMNLARQVGSSNHIALVDAVSQEE